MLFWDEISTLGELASKAAMGELNMGFMETMRAQLAGKSKDNQIIL